MRDVQLTQIVETVQKDMSQFEQLYSHIVNKVYYWCLTTIGNEAEAKDVSQEVMIRIYEKFHTLKRADTFGPWMYSIAKNSCYDFLRSKKKFKQETSFDKAFEDGVELNIEERSPDMLPKEAYDLKETKNLIADFIHKLPRRQKEVVVLYYLEDFSTDDIAEILDLKTGTVRATLHEGRKTLKRYIEIYEEKSQVKLHSIAWLPLLGEIVQEHCQFMGARQNFKYDQRLYNSGTPSPISGAKAFVTNNMFVFIGLVVFIPVIVTAAAFAFFKTDSASAVTFNPFSANYSGIDEKAKLNDLVDSVEYVSFPTTSVKVLIKLKKDIKEDKIKVLLNNAALPFKKDGHNLLLDAKENGKYKIVISGKEASFVINNIDEDALELVEAENHGSFLRLITKGKVSDMDFDKSYVSYLGKRYDVEENLTVKGKFKGQLQIIIFNKDNKSMEYTTIIK